MMQGPIMPQDRTPPRRIRLRRAKGWRMPDGAVKVDRTTRWGNPFVIGEPHPQTGSPMSREEAFALYRLALDEPGGDLAKHLKPGCTIEAARAALAGRDLACWCAPDELCHADHLLRIANRKP